MGKELIWCISSTLDQHNKANLLLNGGCGFGLSPPGLIASYPRWPPILASEPPIMGSGASNPGLRASNPGLRAFNPGHRASEPHLGAPNPGHGAPNRLGLLPKKGQRGLEKVEKVFILSAKREKYK